MFHLPVREHSVLRGAWKQSLIDIGLAGTGIIHLPCGPRIGSFDSLGAAQAPLANA